MKQLNAIVVGLGRIGFEMEGEYGRANPCTHAGAYQRSRKINLVGGFDTDLSQVKKFSERYKKCLVNQKGENLESFLIRSKASIVSVSCSSSSHLRVIRQISKAVGQGCNIKGVLLEKPIGMNSDEALKIQKVLSKLDVQVVVCHDRRFMSEFQYFFKSHFNRKKLGLGDLRHIRGAVHCASTIKGRRGQQKIFGGPMLHDGTHLIDLMIYLVGRPKLVSAWSVRRDLESVGEDTSYGQLWFENSVTGLFLVGGNRKYFHFELEVEWERAKLLFSHGRWLYLLKDSSTPYLKANEVRLPKSKNPYMVRLNHLIDLISDNRKLNLSSIADGVVACQVIDCIYESSRRGGVALSPCGITQYEKEVELLESWDSGLPL